MIPGFHGLDLIVILVVALLIFGPKRLPEMGASIGKSITAFKKGMSEVTADKEEKEKEKEAAAKEAAVKEAPAVIAQEQHYEGGYYPQENVTVEHKTTTTTTAQPNSFE